MIRLSDTSIGAVRVPYRLYSEKSCEDRPSFGGLWPPMPCERVAEYVKSGPLRTKANRSTPWAVARRTAELALDASKLFWPISEQSRSQHVSMETSRTGLFRSQCSCTVTHNYSLIGLPIQWYAVGRSRAWEMGRRVARATRRHIYVSNLTVTVLPGYHPARDGWRVGLSERSVVALKHVHHHDTFGARSY